MKTLRQILLPPFGRGQFNYLPFLDHLGSEVNELLFSDTLSVLSGTTSDTGYLLVLVMIPFEFPYTFKN